MADDADDDESNVYGRSKGRNRVRNLLSAYYGIGRADGSGIDDLDMDSPHFNAELYTAKVIKEKQLDEILRHDGVLVTESKTLASDLQMLVYENYSKFLSSLDTLSLMKQNMQTMEEQMNLLSQKMETIIASATVIDDALATKRTQVEHLAGVDLTLKKIRFLLELPQSLRKCMDRKAYGAAVRCYTVGSNILGKYSHIKSFQHIQEESHEVMLEVKERLREGLKLPLSGKGNDAHVRSCLQLLAELEPSSLTEHQDAVLQPIGGRIQDARDKLMVALEGLNMQHCSKDAVIQLQATELFTPKMDFAAVLSPFIAECEVYNTETQLAEGLFADMGHERHAENLSTVINKVFSAFIDLLIAHMYCRLVFCLGRYSTRRTEQLGSPTAAGSSVTLYMACRQLVDMFGEEWKAYCHAFLDTVGPLLPEDELRQVKATILGEGPMTLFGGLCTRLERLGYPSGRQADPLGREQSDVMICATLVLELLLNTGLNDYQTASGNIEPVLRRLEISHRTLMAQYCRLKGQGLGTLVRSFFTSSEWSNTSVPTSVSALPMDIYSEMGRINAHCMDAIPDSVAARDMFAARPANRRTASESGSESSLLWAGAGSRNIASEMEKIFSTKSYNFLTLNAKPKRLERGPLVECILNYALKCYLECVRRLQISKEGLQQLQVDTHYMKQAYSVYIKKPKALADAADEIFASAQERCLDRQLLAISEVDAMVAKKLSP